ncbi:MAG: hypothetical protein ACR2IP_05065 [Solirubrobacteraceae bacterium]
MSRAGSPQLGVVDIERLGEPGEDLPRYQLAHHARLWLDIGVVSGSVALALALGALTLRRRTL